jgi:ADP-ribose pyrophosphatase
MKITSSKEVYRCRVFAITEDEATDGNGYTISRSVMRHPGAAVMMAVDRKGRLLLVRQYRLPADAYLWELPAGTVDPGEKVAKTAKRELREETGLRAKKWKKLCDFYPSPGCSAEKMTVFLATDLTQGEAQPMADERIETKWFTKKEVAEMIRTNEIRDSKTMVGFLRWAKP